MTEETVFEGEKNEVAKTLLLGKTKYSDWRFHETGQIKGRSKNSGTSPGTSWDKCEFLFI